MAQLHGFEVRDAGTVRVLASSAEVAAAWLGELLHA